MIQNKQKPNPYMIDTDQSFVTKSDPVMLTNKTKFESCSPSLRNTVY